MLFGWGQGGLSRSVGRDHMGNKVVFFIVDNQVRVKEQEKRTDETVFASELAPDFSQNREKLGSKILFVTGHQEQGWCSIFPELNVVVFFFENHNWLSVVNYCPVLPLLSFLTHASV